MFIIMYSLLGIAVLLFIVSLFMKDPYKKLQEDIDQLSIQQVQEIYKIKKKLKVLEEELLIDEVDMNPAIPVADRQPVADNSANPIHAIIKNQVWSLASQGVSIEKIASQSSLSTAQVQQIITEGVKKGFAE
ncbi:hypothetical protein ACQRXC_13720 [Niallia taxi]|uniref:hypothetical protein n=1 Tax=Niallia taxi TaxID=2499688 RepID=UPI00203C12F4|nr:hypothetical protein [Niallia taxi]MCM3215374.1 hypothetical protein [Niallia taxi]